MLTELVAARIPVAYLVTDTHYTAGFITRLATRLGLTWVGTLAPHTTVVHHGRRQQVADLARRLHLRWRPAFDLRATAVTVSAPRHGLVWLVVTSRPSRQPRLPRHRRPGRRPDHDHLPQAQPLAGGDAVHDTKQYAGLGACQCFTDHAMVRHVALVLVTFVLLQHLRRDPTEPVAAVKERWQRAIIRQGQHPPTPLKACPAHLRATA